MFRKIALCITAAIVLGLLVWPKTSWRVGHQMIPHAPRTFPALVDSKNDDESPSNLIPFVASLFPGIDTTSLVSSMDQYAERYKSDADFAIGSVYSKLFVLPLLGPSNHDPDLLFTTNYSRFKPSVIALANANPKSPDALALECWVLIGDRRDQRDSKAADQRQPVLDDWKLMAFAAQAGERADPKNAFFPLVDARAQFALGKKADAFAAWSRASHASRYDPYNRRLADLSARAIHLACGVPLANATAASVITGVFPWYADHRQMARDASAESVRLEKSGNAAGGVAIRHQTMEIGRLISENKSSLIGQLVGAAITAIGAGHPGGDTVKLPSTATSEERAHNSLLVYERYLSSHGLASEIPYAQRTIHNSYGVVVKVRSHSAADDQFIWYPFIETESTALAQWLLCFGLVSVVLALTLRHITKSGEPSTAKTVLGVIGTLVFAILPVWWTVNELIPSRMIGAPAAMVLHQPLALITTGLTAMLAIITAAVALGPSKTAAIELAANGIAALALLTSFFWAYTLVHGTEYIQLLIKFT